MFTADSDEPRARAVMTKNEQESHQNKESEELDQAGIHHHQHHHHRKRRSGAITMSSSGRHFLSVDCHGVQFPSVEKLVEKYSMLITSQQQNLNGRSRTCKCYGQLPSNNSYYSSLVDSRIEKNCRTNRAQSLCEKSSHSGVGEEEGCCLSLSIQSESGLGSEFNSPLSDDGLWFLAAASDDGKRSETDSTVGTLPESDDDKGCPYSLYSRSSSVPFESCDDSESSNLTTEDVFNSVDNIPFEKLTVKNSFRRRQTWTGPLLNEADEGQVADNSGGKLSVRKTCSLDQSMKKFNDLQSTLGVRYLYRVPRKGSTYSNDADFDDDEIGYRSVRTPSVVISDHSNDPNFASSTITLEEIEEFQNCRLKDQMNNALGDSSSDCSGTSIWSNVNNCMNVLDNEYDIVNLERKISDCSTCSNLSFEEEEYAVARTKPSGWRKLRNIVQWTPFFQTYKKQRYPWVQLAGHQGNFKAGTEPGTILKKLCPKEQMCFQVLMKDALKPFVPEYKGCTVKMDDGELYLQLQDLLSEFSAPCVMDCKIGVRTYLEEELAKAKEKPKLRKDMYEKMIQIDSNAPTEEEHKLKGVTKPRYMVWRETISSTATLGFRIEGIRKSDGKSSKDFKTTKTREQIIEAFQDFIDRIPNVIEKYIQRLQDIKRALQMSKFFATHEVIGSSLLFVHDDTNASIWLIDFAKTIILPSEVKIDHASEWIVGNHEDGYLIGINNLIDVFTEISKMEPRTKIEVTAPPKDEVT